MKTEKNKYFNIAILMGVLTLLSSIELPYSDKCIAQLLIPLIRINSTRGVNNVIALAGLIPLTGLILCCIYIIKSKKFNVNGFVIFFIVFVLIMPIISKNINYIKAPIYYFSDGATAVEIIDSRLSSIQIKQKKYIEISVDVKNYNGNSNRLQIALKLPDKFKNYVEDSYILFEDKRLKKDLGDSAYSQINRGIFCYDYSIIIIDDNNRIENIRNDFY